LARGQRRHDRQADGGPACLPALGAGGHRTGLVDARACWRKSASIGGYPHITARELPPAPKLEDDQDDAMNDMSPRSEAEKLQQPTAARRRAWLWAIPVALVALAGGAWFTLGQRGSGSAAQAAPAPPRVTVSAPLQREVDTQVRFLGQFS